MEVLLQQFGAKLKEYRKEKKESQETFAHTLGLNRVQYWRLEKAKTNPSLILLHRIAQHLNITLSELLEGLEEIETEEPENK